MIARRKFITLVGGAAVTWPVVAQAQQAPTRVVGYLHSGEATESTARDFEFFRQGLAETGFVDGQNVRFEIRRALDRLDRLPDLAQELVRSRVDVIYTLGGVAPAMAAKKITSTIPIVFTHGSDPVKAGLVNSLNRPGGNITGVSLFTGQITAKRLELLRELVPKATVIAVLVNPKSATGELRIADVEEAAKVLALKIRMLNVGSENEFEIAFSTLNREPADALLLIADPLFRTHRTKVQALAERYRLPTMYSDRDNVEGGGLMSYGTEIRDVIRQGGIYVGRILNGEKPADLPILLPTRYELVINLKAAKALGLAVPQTLQVAADAVIE